MYDPFPFVTFEAMNFPLFVTVTVTPGNGDLVLQLLTVPEITMFWGLEEVLVWVKLLLVIFWSNDEFWGSAAFAELILAKIIIVNAISNIT